MLDNLQVLTPVLQGNLHGAYFFHFPYNFSIKAPSYYHLFRLIAFYLSFLRYSFIVNVPKLAFSIFSIWAVFCMTVLQKLRNNLKVTEYMH
jgi:hypothetical protein